MRTENHELNIEIQNLHRLSSELAVDSQKISFPRRIEIERCIFNATSWITGNCLKYELLGFSMHDRDHLAPLLEANRRFKYCIMLAFELRAVLSTIASGDAYIAKEIVSAISGGRREATVKFSQRLERFAEELARVSAEM